MTTPRDFAYALLGALNLPTVDNNVMALVALQAMEGGFMHNAAAYNPLNTSQPMPGSHAVTSIGIQAYTSWQQGLDATVKTLLNGRYGAILSALANGAGADTTLSVWAASPWGTTIAAGKHAADYASYGSLEFPSSASSLPSASSGSSASRLGLAAIAAFAIYKLWPLLR